LQADGSGVLGVVQCAQGYVYLTNSGLLYEIDGADPCKSTGK
jgi:hypothetical protein